MKFRTSIALAICAGVLGASSSVAAPTYPPVPGNNGPESRAVLSFTNNSAVVNSKFIAKLSALAISKSSVVTISGYVSKTKNAAADKALGLQRAKNTRAALQKIAPGVKYVVVSKGSTYNAACQSSNNRCSIVTVDN